MVWWPVHAAFVLRLVTCVVHKGAELRAGHRKTRDVVSWQEDLMQRDLIGIGLGVALWIAAHQERPLGNLDEAQQRFHRQVPGVWVEAPVAMFGQHVPRRR